MLTAEGLNQIEESLAEELMKKGLERAPQI